MRAPEKANNLQKIT